MKTISDFLTDLSKDLKTDLDLEYVYQEGMTFREYEEAMQTYINESSDIIYYSRAIEFLSENDPSLQDSMQIAADLGYTPDNLNSEVLASLLNNQYMHEDFSEVSEEIESYFEEYELENEEEE